MKIFLKITGIERQFVMKKYQKMLMERTKNKINEWKKTEEVTNEEIFRLFHSLKGTAASIELIELSSKAEKVLEVIKENQEKNWRKVEWQPLIAEIEPLLMLEKTEALVEIREEVLTREEQGALILLVDNDMDMVEFVKHSLEEKGYTVLVAVNAKKATTIYYEQIPDCVIISKDIQELTEYKILKAMMEKAFMSFIPVVFISQDNSSDRRMKIFQWGAADFLPKPVLAEELLIRLENRLKYKEAVKNAILLDELTGAFNRKFFTLEMSRQVQELSRTNIPFSLAIIDLDHFKQVNDTYGHHVGDNVLVKFANYMQENKRQSDFFIRYGGEEFLLLLPRTKKEDAKQLIERILEGFSELLFQTENETFHVTFSAGITEVDNPSIHSQDYLKQADLALYEVKENGRNGVLIYQEDKSITVSSKKIHVGIIDDDLVVQQIVKEHLAKLRIVGYELDIEVFREGESFFASDWHKQQGKYLIVLDGVMPRMDGLEVLQELRKQYSDKKFMVLMLTGRKNEKDIVRALELGADDYLTKPFSVVELQARVKRLLLRML